jgi:integrase
VLKREDEVPPNTVQRLMGHEHVSTTLQLYVRRTEHHDRIRQALNTAIVVPDDRDDDGITGALVPMRMSRPS